MSKHVIINTKYVAFGCVSFSTQGESGAQEALQPFCVGFFSRILKRTNYVKHILFTRAQSRKNVQANRK